MHSQVTQPGPRGAWRGTDRSGGSRGPRSRTSRTRGRSPVLHSRHDLLRLRPLHAGSFSPWGDKDRDPDVVHLRQRRTRPQEVAVLTDALVQPTVLDVHGGPWLRLGWGLDPEAQWLANRGYLCFWERKGEPRLGSVPTRRPGRPTAQDFVLVRTPRRRYQHCVRGAPPTTGVVVLTGQLANWRSGASFLISASFGIDELPHIGETAMGIDQPASSAGTSSTAAIGMTCVYVHRRVTH